MTYRETEEHYHRPKNRRLVELTNKELALLLKHRADILCESLGKEVFWDSDKIVYWNKFMELNDSVYEILLEIQSRYPASEMKEYAASKILPVKEL